MLGLKYLPVATGSIGDLVAGGRVSSEHFSRVEQDISEDQMERVDEY
jgi:hypothetical protein